jgi:hypothetical protein
LSGHGLAAFWCGQPIAVGAAAGGGVVFQSHRVKLDPDLLARARRCATAAGYASVDEFIAHIVERAVRELEDAGDEQELKRRLKGLGYLS